MLPTCACRPWRLGDDLQSQSGVFRRIYRPGTNHRRGRGHGSLQRHGRLERFRNTFGLSLSYPSGSLTQVHPAAGNGGACIDPGVNGDDGEAALDVEWASAAAPNAAIVMASCADTTIFGGFIALQNLLTNGGPLPGIVSISYGRVGNAERRRLNSYINTLYQTAAAVGVSVFVAAGDSAAAGTDHGGTKAIHGVNVCGFASTIYNVAVGGTDFGDYASGATSTFWNSTNGTYYDSAKSYVREIPWNDSCGSLVLANYLGFSTTYGPAGFAITSIIRTGFLNVMAAAAAPAGAPRAPRPLQMSSAAPAPDMPSLRGSRFSATRATAFAICRMSRCSRRPAFGATIICLLFGHQTGEQLCRCAFQLGRIWRNIGFFADHGRDSSRDQPGGGDNHVGNPNPVYYQIAQNEYSTSAGRAACNSTAGPASTCSFNDVTQGDIVVPCAGTFNCFFGREPGSASCLPRIRRMHRLMGRLRVGILRQVSAL